MLQHLHSVRPKVVVEEGVLCFDYEVVVVLQLQYCIGQQVGYAKGFASVLPQLFKFGLGEVVQLLGLRNDGRCRCAGFDGYAF